MSLKYEPASEPLHLSVCMFTSEGVDDARGKRIAVVPHDPLEVPGGVAVVCVYVCVYIYIYIHI